MKKIIYLNFLILALFALDRLIKFFFLNSPAKRDYLIWPDILELKFSKNPNLALGLKLPLFWQYFLIGVTILIIIRLFLKSYYKKNILLIFSLSLVLIGAFSNLLDRIYYGFVIDFIDVSFVSVFNIADVYIAGGTMLILFLQIQTKKLTK